MKAGRMLYEVTVSIGDEHAAEFQRYMTEKHIREVIETGCFLSATFARNSDGKFRTSYLAASRVDVERYLSEHADRLRKDFTEHFPNGVSVVRDEWTVIHAE